jgi:hypothetical protein
MGETYVYKAILQRSILKNQNLACFQFDISVFVTNAKGGDCWHHVMFAISDNTYPLLYAYRAHHSVSSIYRTFS